jgi:outer membrane protein OmpA-like peptidoglycan-associated protein
VTIPFDQDSNELSGDNLAQLDRLAQHLRAHPALRVRISGHTDAVGSQTYNLSVSRFRANIVKAYLFGKGIAAERTEIEAFGSLKPVADNETRAGREKNRRVEVEVLGG